MVWTGGVQASTLGNLSILKGCWVMMNGVVFPDWTVLREQGDTVRWEYGRIQDKVHGSIPTFLHEAGGDLPELQKKIVTFHLISGISSSVVD